MNVSCFVLGLWVLDMTDMFSESWLLIYHTIQPGKPTAVLNYFSFLVSHKIRTVTAKNAVSHY